MAGFVARTAADELWCPDYEVWITRCCCADHSVRAAVCAEGCECVMLMNEWCGAGGAGAAKTSVKL